MLIGTPDLDQHRKLVVDAQSPRRQVPGVWVNDAQSGERIACPENAAERGCLAGSGRGARSRDAPARLLQEEIHVHMACGAEEGWPSVAAGRRSVP